MKYFSVLIVSLLIVCLLPTSVATQAQTDQPAGKIAYFSAEFWCIRIYYFAAAASSDCIVEDSFDPDWNPGGTQLVLTRGSNPEGYNLYLYDLTTDRLTQVTFGTHVWDLGAWSPNGNWIAFHAQDQVSPDPRVSHARGEGQADIRLLDLDTGKVTTVVTGHIGYTYSVDLQPQPTIWYGPSWDPFNVRLYYTEETYAPTASGSWVPVDHIFIVSPAPDIGPHDLIPLVTPASADDLFSPQYLMPAASPDGNYLAYSASIEGHGDTPDLHVIDLRLGFDSAIALTDGLFATHPDWSPDGRWITFADSGNIYIVKADGSLPPQFLFQGSHPSWAPE